MRYLAHFVSYCGQLEERGGSQVLESSYRCLFLALYSSAIKFKRRIAILCSAASFTTGLLACRRAACNEAKRCGVWTPTFAPCAIGERSRLNTSRINGTHCLCLSQASGGRRGAPSARLRPGLTAAADDSAAGRNEGKGMGLTYLRRSWSKNVCNCRSGAVGEDESLRF